MSKKNGKKACGNCRRCFKAQLTGKTLIEYPNAKISSDCNVFLAQCCNEKSTHYQHFFHPCHFACKEFEPAREEK